MRADEIKTSSRKHLSLIAILVCVLAISVATYWHLSSSPATAKSTDTKSLKSGSMLRFAGSNTIGSELLPALAEAYMKQLGVNKVQRTQLSSVNEVAIINVNDPSRGQTIEIASHGSSTGFKALSVDAADIGMSSRRIKAKEVTKLSQLGDMTSAKNEHVLALDGVAVIVHPSNPIAALTKEQIAAIFSGVVTDWSELNGSRGAINIYARDNNSGTYDTFKSLALRNLELSERARRFEDNAMLSDRVSSDPNGIGFVGLPFVRKARALAVSEMGTTPLLPNRLTVSTEDYPFARRLYLYTPTFTNNPHVKEFAQFALSKEGQEIVKRFGFVELNLQTSHSPVQSDAPTEYQRLTANAKRLTLNFRFMSGSYMLDNKAVRDLDRVIEYIESERAVNRPVMLFGFSDSIGDEAINMKLSRERAKAVADELMKRGVKVASITGLGASMAVASNRTEEGRERNRRVEIWIQN